MSGLGFVKALVATLTFGVLVLLGPVWAAVYAVLAALFCLAVTWLADRLDTVPASVAEAEVEREAVLAFHSDYCVRGRHARKGEVCVGWAREAKREAAREKARLKAERAREQEEA